MKHNTKEKQQAHREMALQYLRGMADGMDKRTVALAICDFLKSDKRVQKCVCEILENK